MSIKYITDLSKIEWLSEDERKRLERVVEIFPFRANDYYLSLIDPSDPNDPIRKIVIPSEEELVDWGSLDPSDEKSYTKIKGLEHKYPDTVLLLVSQVCGGICRYCFRKRLFLKTGGQVEVLTSEELQQVFSYLREHPEVTDVLLSGGDPLMLSTPKLREIIEGIAEIPHIKVIRIGSKMPAYNPFRILEDDELLKLIEEFSKPNRRIYVITQFNHPRELTETAISALDKLLKAGAILSNQSPILRGINDNPETLRELMLRLEGAGDPPYYFFINRPVLGTRHFSVPIERAYLILEEAKKGLSGLARRVKLAMSHKTGKIEVIGLTNEYLIVRYHRAANPNDHGKVMFLERNPQGLWLEDFKVVKEYSLGELEAKV